MDDRTKLEDEKRRTVELQTSIGQLKSNVGTLEQALFQSTAHLKAHVEHVDTQQTTNDGLQRQVQELEGSLESSRKELDDKMREITDRQNAALGLDTKVQKLKQTLQSTKDCLANEKSLSNAGQASTAILTLKVHELEHSLNEARKEVVNENNRHVAQQQNIEESLRQSKDSLDVSVDRCNSQQASIDILGHKVQHLENSLGVANETLKDEKRQSAVQQASVKELGITAKQLEASLHFASDCLQDEKSRHNMYQASISSLTAKVRNLEQSLCLAHVDLEENKRQNQDSIVSMEAHVQKLEKSLELTRSDLGDKRMRCVAQAASMAGLEDKVQDLAGELNKSRQCSNAQQRSLIGLKKVKQELEKSLQASRDDIKTKEQLYRSLKPCIDHLQRTESELQQSLESSHKETQAEKDRCTTQQSSIAEMQRELQKLKVDLESTRGELERAERLRSAHSDGATESNMHAPQIEDGFESVSTGAVQPAGVNTGLTLDDNPTKSNTARKRYNSDGVELDSQRQAKRHQGTPTTDAIISTVSNTGPRQRNLAEETEAGDPKHVPDPSNTVQNSASTRDPRMSEKLTSLEQIRRSPWIHDKSEGACHFIDSLTPALSVVVLSRLARLSRSCSVQQVVLQINLRQLRSMEYYFWDESSTTIPPIVKSGFAITESHVSDFSCFYIGVLFGKAMLERLLDYRLSKARFGSEVDAKRLGFRPSGLFTLIPRKEARTGARTLRERFDAEKIATVQEDQVVRASVIREFGVDIGSSTSQTSQIPSKQADVPRVQTQTDMSPVTVTSGGSEKSNGHPSESSKNTAAISKVQKSNKAKRKWKPSQVAPGAQGRPKRTTKPSRRAAEAACTR